MKTKAKIIHGYNWKGGRIDDGHGYILIYKPDYYMASARGYVREHRFVYEEYFKCCVLNWVDVHHLNHIKTDNRIENLQLLPHGIHAGLSSKKDMSNRLCSSCGGKTTLLKKNKYEQWENLNNKLVCHRCYNKWYHEAHASLWRKGGKYAH